MIRSALRSNLSLAWNPAKASKQSFRCMCSTENLAKTAFYDLHLELGGKMVPFAGYHLPVQYEGLGVLKEHLHTRADNCASLFDVSHMGQILWHGKDAATFIEKMVVGDIKSLKTGEAKLSLIMNEDGHIVDDTVITNAGDHIYMVVNGACKVDSCQTQALFLFSSHFLFLLFLSRLLSSLSLLFLLTVPPHLCNLFPSSGRTWTTSSATSTRTATSTSR